MSTSVAHPFAQLYPPARSEVYRTVGGHELKLHFFGPGPDPCRTAVLFFFGGGWVGGTPAQFFPHAVGVAARGALAVVVEYRVNKVHGTSPVEAVADAKAAVRWVRAHAERLGVSSERIVAAGGSAGGHLAAAAALLPLEEPGADGEISCVPDALLLFNPVLDTCAAGFGAERMGPQYRELSPQHHVRQGLPPTIIFHGTADTVVPFAQATRFADAMTAAGNVCELVPAEGLGHGFFNPGRVPDPYAPGLDRAMRFLAARGLLNAAYAADPTPMPAHMATAVRSSRLAANLAAGRKQTVVTYGTSLTAGGAWGGQLREALKVRYPGLFHLRNSGLGGMWSGWGVVNLEPRVLRHGPDAVIIEFAVNDAYQPYACSVAQARLNLEFICGGILRQTPDAEIILQVMNPPIAEHAVRRPHWPDYYQMIRDCAREHDFLLVDHQPAWQAVLDQGEAAFRALVPDGIHPSAEGAAAVTTPGLLEALGFTGH